MSSNHKNHFADIDAYRRKLTLQYKGETVATTENALIYKEVSSRVYDPVYYIPKQDILVELEMEPGTKGHCPIKGHYHNWYLKGDRTASYFAWSYEAPLPVAEEIKEHIAFNPAYITFISAPL
ncbi:MAG: DUF427 domain-containing protein [Bacteroidota bacterium]